MTPRHSPPRTGTANWSHPKYGALWNESGQLRNPVDDVKTFGDSVGMIGLFAQSNAMLETCPMR